MQMLLSRIIGHISSISLVAIYAVAYMMGDHKWLNQYLPDGGKPFILFIILAIVVLYEFTSYRFRALEKKLCGLSDQICIANLKMAVNALYNRFTQSDDEFIDNDYTIKELMELKDIREKYGVNSYTQDRLHFLCTKIKR